MKIAFYAPMKPPDAPRPSGDRTIARLLLRALAMAGHEPFVASKLRSRLADPADGAARQRIERQAGDEVRRLAGALRRDPPALWFTYHLFYKAPDPVGPAVCRALGLPYVVAEASHAPKRAAGPWAAGHAQVGDALRLADHIFFPNPADEACVLPLLKPGATHSRLPPTVEVPAERTAAERARARQELAREWRLDADAVWALAVGMMRTGDKLASYARLAAAWAAGTGPAPACLLIVGDGPAEAEVRRLFAPFSAQTRFLGRLEADRLEAAYAAADLFAWPGANEAIGMATLEAMAAGLPVATGPCGAVAQTIVPGVTGLVTRSDADFARALARLIADPALRRRLGAAARAGAARRHGLPAAAAALGPALRDVAGRAAGRAA